MTVRQVIIPDLNLLICAHDSGSRNHGAARAWWEALMNGARTVGLPWVAVLGFLCIATNPMILARPLDVAGVRARVES